MTTKVTIEANHGWPVKVSRIDTSGENEIVRNETIVSPGQICEFAVWDSQDLRIHEIQPDEEITD